RLQAYNELAGYLADIVAISGLIIAGYEGSVSTSHPDGDGAKKKNCTRLYREKPTQRSYQIGGCSDDMGRFFLHFTIECALNKKFNYAKKLFFLDAA
ncbi:MAG: hypothetical protein JNL51_12155, partial [Chitinophagaceae bacterium]|nr:hypothetical protein [Chitinophagaceae bacterium]